MPFFQPLIGSGFSDLNNQALAWHGFNTRVAADNIARANASEQIANNWLANVAQMRDAAMNRNLAIAERERNLGLNLAEARRRDALAAGFRADEIQAAQDAQEAQQEFQRERDEANRDFQLKMFDKQNELAQENIDISGQHIASKYGPAKDAADEAQQRYEDLQDQIVKAKATLAAETVKKKPDANVVMTQTKLAGDLEKQLNRAQRERDSFARAVAGLENQAFNAGFTINEDGSIVHPQSQKTWRWKKALEEAKAEVNPGMGWGRAFSKAIAEGGVPATITATTPAPAVAAPTRIGRFTIVTE